MQSPAEQQTSGTLLLYPPVGDRARLPRTARPARRHRAVLISFAVLVLAPLLLAGWYLFTRAADQYASRLGFVVRQQEMPGSVDILGGITQIGSPDTSDSDILFSFIQSEHLVRAVDQSVNLKKIWSAPDRDTWFRFDAGGTYEDLADYWHRMVHIQYDARSGLIELRVNAFDPKDANAITAEILAQSSAMINRLSMDARNDATHQAEDELSAASERLKSARQAITLFRATHRIVDPSADIGSQMGVLGNLQQRLADAYIQIDLLHDVTTTDDPRVRQAQRRVSVIQKRIQEERSALGTKGGVDAIQDVLAEFEALRSDVEFAEQSYFSARGALDLAKADARRKSKYLASYLGPTLADTARFPRRSQTLAMMALFALLIWSIVVMAGYAIRDRY